jgi:large repetitive protein
LNEGFIVEDLNDFPNNSITIINRWGSVVFEAKPYLNDWRGVNMLGNPLPEGVYYYILRLDPISGDVRSGSITIKY